jgi:transaldolase
MRPANLQTKIFLDGGDPGETKEAIRLLGFLDGQTTNPTLIAKNPSAQKRLAEGRRFQKEEILDFYRNVVSELSELIPQGSVSVEVYADPQTTADEMLAQGKEMFGWIPNAHVKFPITTNGLRATEAAIREGLRVNLTLCFSLEQAAAVYAATRGAARGRVFVSPFIGRLDDIGQNGMDLVANIVKLYESGDGHVEALAASVRTIEHLEAALALRADIITAPLAVLAAWHERGLPVPGATFRYQPNLAPIPYRDLDLNRDWREFDISHPLTDKGVARFAADWNALIA